ncbi:MAG: glycosyltransferase family 4 protein [Bacteroidia bacterium]|nr:glycosyltransferase family 4 protein [Bacteroidia bacterium]
MLQKKRFLVLFEEMAPYFWECLRALAGKYPVEIMLVCKKVNPIAPFQFEDVAGIKKFIREEYFETELLKQIKDFSPDAVYVSGWLYKPYHEWLKFIKAGKVIIGLDTQWNGNIRQQAGSIFFRFFKKKYYTHAFVPNQRQVKFALKLGFAPSEILTGIYCCDTDFFWSIYKNKVSQRKQWPKNFLFIGRYVHEKGFMELQHAFLKFHQKHPGNGWKLLLAGKGPLKPLDHPGIRDLGFIQPPDLPAVIDKAGFFIIPSTFEPYGVVIHEMACAGIPIMASRFCGAADDYVEDGKNGFLINEVRIEQILRVMENVLSLNDENLKKMSEASHALSLKNSKELWSEKIYKLLSE